MQKFNLTDRFIPKREPGDPGQPDLSELRFQQAMNFRKETQSLNANEAVCTETLLSRRIHNQLLESALLEPGKIMQFCSGAETRLHK